MRNNAELFIHGNVAQLEKLKENEHKRSFEEFTVADLRYIIKRIGDELTEASTEVYEKKVNIQEARKEFADIANFAHIGIYICDKKLGKRL